MTVRRDGEVFQSSKGFQNCYLATRESMRFIDLRRILPYHLNLEWNSLDNDIANGGELHNLLRTSKYYKASGSVYAPPEWRRQRRWNRLRRLKVGNVVNAPSLSCPIRYDARSSSLWKESFELVCWQLMDSQDRFFAPPPVSVLDALVPTWFKIGLTLVAPYK